MAHSVRLPPNILREVFVHLTAMEDDSIDDMTWQDLLYCSFTCWGWKEIANEILYHQVYIGDDYASSKLLKTIAMMAQIESIAANNEFTNTPRRQQFGSLIQVVNIEIDIEDSLTIHHL
jgi:hypothetical protein